MRLKPRRKETLVSRLGTFYRSTVGKKAVVAITGLVMLGFLVGHVSGNLKVFLPDPEPGLADIDLYAAFLRSMGEPLLPHAAALWAARLILLASLVLHVVCVIQLSALNRSARPVGYKGVRYVRATLAARWMMLSGLLLSAFIVFHILHFTTGSVDRANFEEGAVYANLYHAFQRWPFVVLYVVAMGAVALHLYHGAWSVFQSLGLDNPDRNLALRVLGLILAITLFLGFVTVPASFWAGALEAPAGSVSSLHQAPPGSE